MISNKMISKRKVLADSLRRKFAGYKEGDWNVFDMSNTQVIKRLKNKRGKGEFRRKVEE